MMPTVMLIGWMGAMAGADPAATPTLPSSLDYTALRAVPAQHEGRWPPLDTVARDLVYQVTGTERFRGADPMTILLAWTFDAAAWEEAPLIAIRNAELRKALSLPLDRETFSYAELVAHRPLRALAEKASRKPEGEKPDPLERKVNDIYEKLVVMQGIFQGRSIRLVPDAEDVLGTWRPIAEGSADEKLVSLWKDVKTAFLANDAKAFADASQKLAAALRALPAAHRPDATMIAMELRSNRLHPFRLAWEIMLLGGGLGIVALIVRRRGFDVLNLLVLAGGVAVLTWGLWMRWRIAGRIPASNMYESLLLLGWGAGAFAIVSMLVIRHRAVPLTASLLGAVALMLADLLPIDPFIKPIPPVLLDTVWMGIHVPIIMVSYSVLALGVLIAHVQLVAMAAAPHKHRWIASIDSLHHWYIHVGSVLLLAGILTGSMWANSSWGRYWGWDPKEVWSLVALLGYLTILHVRLDREVIPWWTYLLGAVLMAAVFALTVPRLVPLTAGKIYALAGAAAAIVIFVVGKGPFATALKSVLAFWLIIMTYVGVNYVLGTGLHSYGFGTGAVVRHMFQWGGADLALIGVCTLVYLLRRSASSGARPAEIALA